MGFIFYNNGTYVNSSTIGRNVVEIPNGVNQIKFNIYNPNGITPSNIYEVQLELGSTPTEYEEYTGGNPSPNPDHPQSINVVTGEQEVSVVGKNLFDKDNITYGYIAGNGNLINDSSQRNALSDYIEIEPNTNYIFSANTIMNGLNVAFFDNQKQFTTRQMGQGASSNLFNSGNNSYMRLWCNFDGTNATTPSVIESKEVQLEKGSTSTEYKPYTEQNYKINLGKNLFNFDKASSPASGLTSIIEGTNLKITGTAETTSKNITNILSNIYPVGDYTFSISSAISSPLTLRFFDDNSERKDITIPANSTSISFNLDGTEKTYRLVLNSEENKTYNIDINLQLERGLTATDYAPYFTPIELCGIGDYKDAIKKSSGKNLFDKNNIVYGKSWNDGPDTKRARGEIKDRPNQDITISVKNISNLDFVRLVLTNDNFSANLVAHTFTNNDSYTLTPNYSPQLTRYEIEIQKTNISSSDLENVEIQIEKGSSATTYEPHN